MLYESKIEPTKPCIWSISCYINNLDRSIYTGFGAVPDFERIMALVSLAYPSIRWSTRHGIITNSVKNCLVALTVLKSVEFHRRIPKKFTA